MKTQAEEPRWNGWTTLAPVQFDYEATSTPRAVRLTQSIAQVGNPVRVGLSGVEVEGRISAIDGSTLQVTLSATGAGKKKMAKITTRPQRTRRSGS